MCCMMVSRQIVPDELLELLGKAVTCAVLGKVGSQRVRVMTLLYKVFISIASSIRVIRE